MEALEIIRKIIRENPDLQGRVAPERLALATRFREDMGMDSLGTMSLFFELQEHFPHLRESDLPKWKSLADCIGFLERG